jgi:hypothetical protein
MMILETGFPLTRMGLNGLEGPGFAPPIGIVPRSFQSL